jgi:hypothetical protein
MTTSSNTRVWRTIYPPEIARQIDPTWRNNEAAYWAVRDQLLRQYQGQWIGFANGAVIASGSSPVAVFHAAEATGKSPFVTCVGRENEPVRMRRSSFSVVGHERILGRDVLNRLDILFRGPVGELIANP